jgi:acyl-CoA reductase-like NAD-dependent aldehyde dehydrogenase
MKAFNLLIDSQMKPGSMTMEIMNPTTGKILAECPRPDERQLNDAIAAAKRAFPAWAKTSHTAKRTMIHAIARLQLLHVRLHNKV